MIDSNAQPIQYPDWTPDQNDFQNYFHMGTVGLAVTAPGKGWLEVNDRLCQMLGYSRSELTQMTWEELTYPDDLDADLVLFNQVMAGEQNVYQLEKRFIRKDGEIVHTTLSVACHRNPDQTVRYFLASLVDITETRRSQNLIQLRLELSEFAASHSLDDFMSHALDEICRVTGSSIGFYHFVSEDQLTLHLQAWSTRTKKEFCNAAGKGMHYRVDQAGVWADCVRLGHPIIHNDYASVPNRKGLPEGHAAVVRELVVPVIRDGKTVSILGVGNKNIDYKPGDVEIVVFLADATWEITLRKQAEETTQKLLQERKVLLQELLHRAKNSFAMISGMITLLADANPSPDAQHVLSDLTGRVHAVSILYDLLYTSETVMDVQLDVYCSTLVESLCVGRGIDLIQHFDSMRVPVKMATPVGLILTELVTNSLKYAFPKHQLGTISIELRRNQTHATLIVEDNGVGLPPAFDLASSTSMGLTLIQMLAGQLQADFSLERGPGTRGVLKFPIVD